MKNLNWLEYGVGLFLLYMIYSGYRKGFLKSIFSSGSFFVALILTILINPQVSKQLQNNQTLHRMMHQKLAAIGEEKNNKQHDTVMEQENYIDQLPLPNPIKYALQENNNQEVYRAMKVKSFQEYVIQYLIYVSLNAISFLGTFLLVKVALFLVLQCINIIGNLPVIHSVDRLAGFCLGGIKGIFILWIIGIGLSIFSGEQIVQKIYQQIAQSPMLLYLYDHNILLKTITSTAKILF